MDSSSALPRIVIVGAGVLGLSAAVLLQRRFPGRGVIMVADEFPVLPSSSSSPSSSMSVTRHTASYASAWAGAHYRPIFPSTPQLRDEAVLARRTFQVMERMARETPEAGVEMMQGVEYFDKPSEGELEMGDGDVYAGVGDGFRVLKQEELVGGVRWGCEYRTYCVNVPLYGAYWLRRFEENGGRVIKQRIQDVMEAFEVAQPDGLNEVSTVVNCSGTNFGHDPRVKIIRGQTCLVKNPYHRTVTRQYADGRWATLIPRPLGGGTIVGVSKEVGDEEDEPRPETRQLLLEQSTDSFPDFVRDLAGFEVIQDNVGRRPYREGGARIEIETFEGGRKRLVHGYGVGGRGYELSWAIAERLVDLVSSSDSGDAAPEVP